MLSPQVVSLALHAPLLARAGARYRLAVLLRGASVSLARAAQHLAGPVRHRAQAEPQLEFHADAGAPEGALYADGVLVGLLPGVSRL